MSNNNSIDEIELEKANEEAEASEGTFTIKLKKPVNYNGKEYKELSFDFDALTGRDGLSIENELQSLGKVAVIPAFSGEYLVRMAAKACSEKIGADLFDTIALHDYNRIRSAARSFLLKSE